MKTKATLLGGHGGEIPDFDPWRPLLPRLDRLSDDQLKAAMASMDPLAR